jgi:GT2 family glycosyltransferase
LSSSIPLEIIVVDNKSTDDSVSYITNNFPEIKVIQNDENAGFAKANNIGLKFAYNNNKDYFFLLNQDAWVEYNTIETLIGVADEKPEFGVLSPIHLTADKSFFDKGFLNFFTNWSDTIHAYESLYLNKTQPILYESRFVNAAAWLITRKCIEIVGGFDTILFRHYGEDDNYCQRVLFHNLKIGIVPSVTICHDKENSVDKPRDEVIKYSVIHGNVLLTKKVQFMLVVKILLRAVCGRIYGISELFFIISRLKRIAKSKKTNMAKGGGLKYIENI